MLIPTAGHMLRRRGLSLRPDGHVLPSGGVCAPRLRRKISATFRTASSSSADGAGPFNVASGQGAPDEVQFAGVLSTASVTAEAPQTITGRGLNWVKIDEQYCAASGTTRKISIYRGIGKPTAAQLAITFANPMLSVIWIDFELVGADPTGADAANAIVQIFKAGSAAATTINATFAAALENPANAMLVLVGIGPQGTIVADPDFTMIGQDDEAAATGTEAAMVAVGQTTCDPTFPSGVSGIIAMEIRAGMA